MVARNPTPVAGGDRTMIKRRSFSERWSLLGSNWAAVKVVAAIVGSAAGWVAWYATATETRDPRG